MLPGLGNCVLAFSTVPTGVGALDGLIGLAMAQETDSVMEAFNGA
jgi:hypothetical protein